MNINSHMYPSIHQIKVCQFDELRAAILDYSMDKTFVVEVNVSLTINDRVTLSRRLVRSSPSDETLQ